MTERINHAAEALSYIQEAHDMTPTGYRKEAGTQYALQEAQVHATLALVEQQRIANLIALAGLEMNGPLRHLVIQPDGPYSVDVKPDIAAALGLTAGQEGEDDEQNG